MPLINTSINNLKYKRVMLSTARRPALGTTALHYGDLRPPLGLGYIATVLENHGVEVVIVDNYLAPHDMSVEIDNFKPDLIGIYTHTPGYYVALDLIDEIRSLTSVPLVAGGPHASLKPETLPAKVDHIVQGEGEHIMLNLCYGHKYPRLITHEMSGRINQLDELPFPNYNHFWGKPYNWNLDLYNIPNQPVLTMHTSRSCPYRCSFCGVASIWTRKYTQFSAKRILKEIDKYVERYGARGIYFREDLFTTSTVRLKEMCDGLIERDYDLVWACEARADITDRDLIEKMYQSGCRGLYLGVEAGSETALKRKKKDLELETMKVFFRIANQVGLPTYATFAMGTPGETDKEIVQTEEFIKEINPTAVDRFAYLGLPTSEDYMTLLKNRDYYHMDSAGIIYTERFYEMAHRLYEPNDPRIYFLEQQKKLLAENRGDLTREELAAYRYPAMPSEKLNGIKSSKNDYLIS